MARKEAAKALAGRRTFASVADEYIALKAPTFRSEKHAKQWATTLGACADLRGRFIDEISTADVLRTLEPIWATTPETGKRLRGRIESVLGYATAKGWRSGENPARWRAHLSTILPARGALDRGRHAALPWQGVPAFVAALPDSIPALALQFLILTGARAGEVLGAQWSELDVTARMWTIEPHRTKRARIHEVPLSAAAIAIVERMREIRAGPFLFPGRKPGKPLSDTVMRALIAGKGTTCHGFRASLRSWCADTGVRREVAEACLAHAVGNAVELAYQRSSFLEERRDVMEKWGAFVTGGRA